MGANFVSTYTNTLRTVSALEIKDVYLFIPDSSVSHSLIIRECEYAH